MTGPTYDRDWQSRMPEGECRLGRIEYDGARYCHEHCGFLEPGVLSNRCNKADGPGCPGGGE